MIGLLTILIEREEILNCIKRVVIVWFGLFRQP